ncbi:protein S100-A16-like [Strigops habroptila]|uniref:protein S100-A16-like n=1 Tax=Strigops habroptila TaxID=2489341 RepID=UPI0011CF062D|nr:protein S100-A16-like [Strigops habroptila]
MGQSQGGGTSTNPSGCPHGDVPMSPLEQGLQAVVDTFYRYAQAPAEGLEPTLDPSSFQRLLRLELGRQLRDTGQPRAVAAVFSLLDANGDQRISFSEYWQLVAWLCHIRRHRHYGASAAPPPPTFCCPGGSHRDSEIQPGGQ